jgi:hypothetical protein
MKTKFGFKAIKRYILYNLLGPVPRRAQKLFSAKNSHFFSENIFDQKTRTTVPVFWEN